MEKLKVLLSTLMLIKYIISNNIEHYPKEIVSAIDMDLSQIENINTEIENFMKSRQKA